MAGSRVVDRVVVAQAAACASRTAAACVGHGASRASAEGRIPDSLARCRPAAPDGAGPANRECVPADRRAALRAARAAAAAFGVPGAEALQLAHRFGAPPVPLLPSAAGRVAPPFEVAIAHAGGRAIAAVASSGMQVGVDLAEAESVAASEVAYFCAAGEAGRGLDATTRWALKEATWKAARLGADLPFGALRLDVTAGGTVRGVVVHGHRVPAVARVWRPWKGWIAALVVLQASGQVQEAA